MTSENETIPQNVAPDDDSEPAEDHAGGPAPTRIAQPRFRSLSSAPARLIWPRLVAITIVCFVGMVIWGWPGLFVGMFFSIAVVIFAWTAAGHYPLDLHDGKVLDVNLSPDTFRHVESITEDLKIEQPALWLIDVEEPQMCACASGLGNRIRGRIGISKALLREASDLELYSLLAIACVRIASGEATINSASAALAGIPLQLALAPGLNFQIGNVWRRDPSCGLTPLGKFLLIIMAPMARAALAMGDVTMSVLTTDIEATKLMGYSSGIGNALRWISEPKAPILMDPVWTYNPAEAALYIVSPFDRDFDITQPSSTLPLWMRARFLITGLVPNTDLRIARLPADPVMEFPEDEPEASQAI